MFVRLLWAGHVARTVAKDRAEWQPTFAQGKKKEAGAICVF